MPFSRALAAFTLAVFWIAYGTAYAQVCTTSWAAAVSGDWNTGANWTGGVVPGPLDDACVTAAPGTYTVSNLSGAGIDVNSLTLGSFASGGDQTLESSRGIVLAAPSKIDTEGTLLWINGLLSGGTTITNFGQIVIDGSPIGAARGVSGIGTTLINQASASWLSGNFYLLDDGAFVNNGIMSAVLTAGTSGNFLPAGADTGSRLFSNNGVLQVSGGTLLISVRSRHDGAAFGASLGSVLQLQSALHTFAGTSTAISLTTPGGEVRMSGPFAAESGATWDFSTASTGLRWTAGFLQGGETLTNTGLLKIEGTGIGAFRGIDGAGSKLLNDGRIEWTDDDVFLQNDGAMENSNTLVAIDAGAGSPALRPTGTDSGFREFNNLGLIEVQNGTLTLFARTIHNGAELTASAGATLLLGASDQRFVGAITGAPAGNVTVNANFSVGPGTSWAFSDRGMHWASGFLKGGETLTNTGAVRIEGSGIGAFRGVSDLGSVFANSGSVTWTEDDFFLADDGGVENTGTIQVTYTSGSLPALRTTGADTGSRLFENSGSVEVTTGELIVQSRSRHDGAVLSANAGASLSLEQAEHTFAGATTGAPAGDVVVLSTFTAEPGASWDLSGTGMRWGGGFLTGGETLVNNGRVRIEGAGIGAFRGVSDLGSVFQNDATAVWVEDYITLRDDGSFINNGLLEGRQTSGPDPFMTMQGVDTGFRRLLNNGEIDVLTGIVLIQANAVHNGATLNAASGASLTFENATQEFAGSTSGSPDGDVIIKADVSVPTSASWNVSGAGLQWQRGFQRGGSVLTNTGRVTLNGDFIGAARGVEGLGTEFINGGELVFVTDGFFLSADGVLRNTGTTTAAYPGTGPAILVAESGVGTGAAMFDNEGLLTVLAGSVLDIDVPFTHAAGALINGTGTIDFAGSALTYEGDTAPGAPIGTLTWTGKPWAPTSVGSKLVVELDGTTAGAGHDQLIVGGAVTLGGALEVVISPTFAPSVGDTFTIMTGSSVTGAFASFVAPPGYAFTPIVNPTNVVLETTAVGATATLTGAEGWRMLAPSVSAQTLDGVVSSIWTQGYPGADHDGGGSNVWYYDETVVGGIDAGFVLPAMQSDAFPLGKGVLAFVYSDDDFDGTPEGFPKHLTQSGSDHVGAFAFSPTLTSSGTAADDGWNLIGNPYAASMDWDAAGWTKTGMSTSIYIWDPAFPAYRAWNGFAGTLPNGLVAPSQAAWVQALSAPTLSAPAAARSTGGSFLGRSGAGALRALTLSLQAVSEGVSVRNDAIIHIHADAAPGLDPFDAYELPPLSSPSLELATSEPGGILLDIQAVPTFPQEVPLHAAALGEVGSIDARLKWDGVDLLGVTGPVELLDRETGDVTDMRAVGEYSFALTAVPSTMRDGTPATPQATTKSAELARFAIRFGGFVSVDPPSAVPDVFALSAVRPNPFARATAFDLSVPESGYVSVEAYDTVGRRVAVIATGELAAGVYALVFDASSLPAGVYMLRASSGVAVLTKRVTRIR